MLKKVSESYSARTTTYNYTTPSWWGGYVKSGQVIDTYVFPYSITMDYYTSVYDSSFAALQDALDDTETVATADTLSYSDTYVCRTLEGTIQPSVYKETLGLDNVVTYTPVSSNGSTYWSWMDAGFFDPFQYLTASDFSSAESDADGNFEFPLNLGDVDQNLVAKGFASQLSDSSISLTYAALVTDGTDIIGVKLRGYEIYDEGTYYESVGYMEAESTITGYDLPDSENQAFSAEPSKNYTELAPALESLKSDNFTITQTGSNESSSKTVIKANPDNYVVDYYSSSDDESDLTYAYYQSGSDVDSAIELGDGAFYKTPTTYSDSTFSDGYPSFDVSSDVFDYDEGSDTYVLSASASGDTSTFGMLSYSYAVYGGALKLKLIKDSDGNLTGIDFSQAEDYAAGVYDAFDISFTDIGSTDTGLDISSIKDNVDNVPWSVLTPAGNAAVESLLGVNLDDSDIPTIGGIYSIWDYYANDSSVSGWGSTYVELYTTVDEELSNQQFNELVSEFGTYFDLLLANGYSGDSSTADSYGLYSVSKTVVGIDGEELTLEVTPVINWYYNSYQLALELSLPSVSESSTAGI